MRLGELLVGTGDVTPEQVQLALSRQIIHGGRLGSNLVELGFISMEQLALGLGRQHQLPAALEAHYDQLDRSLAAKLSPELAASWHAIPLGRAGPEGAHVAIATTDPFIPDVAQELSAIFDADIIQAIAPEMRLLYWLEQVYGIERLNRFKRIDHRAQSDDGEYIEEEAGAERRQYVHTIAEDEEFTDTGALARIAVKRIAVPFTGEVEIPLDPSQPDAFLRAIRQANGRSRMANLVGHFLQHGFDEVFSAGMLVVVREDVLVGWKGFVRGAPSKAVDALAIPLNIPSMLAMPYASSDTFFGFPDAPASIDHRLWNYLGGSPQEIAILPVEVSGRIACMLYVQSTGPIPAEHAGTLGELARCISACLTQLIRNASR